MSFWTSESEICIFYDKLNTWFWIVYILYSFFHIITNTEKLQKEMCAMLLFVILMTFTEQTNMHVLMLFCQGHERSSCNLELDPAQNETVMLHAFPHLTEQQKCKTLPLVTVDGIVSCRDTEHRIRDSQKSVFTFPLYCPSLLMLLISKRLKIEQTPSLSSFNPLTSSLRHSLTINL